ncbi:heterokaryon incompatibility protein-domain-containing protein [Xylaria sp. FL0933]|nr:heterokaryon incompatibility protein-domain-containing protein [Xylaria sp. FL0933]
MSNHVNQRSPRNILIRGFRKAYTAGRHKQSSRRGDELSMPLYFSLDERQPYPGRVIETSMRTDSTVEWHEPSCGRAIKLSYKYSKLSYPDSLRVFILAESVDRKATIHGELVEHRLSDDTPAQGYTALSYAWGDVKGAHMIFIGDRPLTIGHNLITALRDLRWKDRPIRLWVDALCINQEDVSERNHQVQQMRSIYSSALETIIYLGGEQNRNVEYSAWTFLVRRNATWAMNENGDADPDLPPGRESMTCFCGDLSDVEIDVLQRPWFKRLWVFQEVVVSKSLSIQCGRRRIPWDDFCKTVLLSPEYHDRYGFSLRAVGRPDIVRDMFQTRCSYQELHGMGHVLPPWRSQVQASKHITLDILDLLQRTRWLKASDPRDKVFGLLGISSGIDVEDQRFAIDYSQDCCSVYTRFAREIIRATRSYDILSYIDHGLIGESEHIGRPHSIPQLPSWVPDWDLSSESDWPLRTMRTILSTLDSGADMPRSQNLQPSDPLCHWDRSGEVLVAAGSIIGQILHVSKTILLPRDAETLFQNIREWEDTENGRQTSIMNEWASYLKTSSYDYRYDQYFDIDRCSKRGTVEHHLLTRAHETASCASEHLMGLRLATIDKASIVDGKCIATYEILGDSGTRGLAIVPADTKRGCFLIDLYGSRVPFVIAMNDLSRSKETFPSTSSEIRYCRLIGEAVVNRTQASISKVRERVFGIW